ncbi:hypothetical protein [Marispirochaeta aestuarii]|uniref:hypothetical protein n=1 Tax=Marispirochaeta aestuarii TaxID=1963862 RepID=UPI0037485E0A
MVNRGLISSWAKSGVPVQVWTVNEPEEAKRLFGQGSGESLRTPRRRCFRPSGGFDPDGESPPYRD